MDRSSPNIDQGHEELEPLRGACLGIDLLTIHRTRQDKATLRKDEDAHTDVDLPMIYFNPELDTAFLSGYYLNFMFWGYYFTDRFLSQMFQPGSLDTPSTSVYWLS
jgi:hypothetical protein